MSVKSELVNSAAIIDEKYAAYGKTWADTNTFWPDAFIDACRDAAAGNLTLDNRAPKAAKTGGKGGKKGATTIEDDASRIVDLMAVSFAKNAGVNTTPLAAKTITTKKSELRVAIGLGALKPLGVNGVNLLVSAREERKNAGDAAKAVYNAFLAVGRLQLDSDHIAWKDGKPVTLKAKLTEDEIKSAVREKPTDDATLESVWISIGATLSALTTAGKRKDGLVETNKDRKALAEQVIAVAAVCQAARDRKAAAQIAAAANEKADAIEAAATAKLAAIAKTNGEAAKAAKAAAKTAAAKRSVPTKRGK